MSTGTTRSVAAEVDQWLSEFGTALVQGDAAAAADMFGEDSFWRDLQLKARAEGIETPV